MKKNLLLMMMLLCVGMLTGCSGNSKTTDNEEKKQEKTVTETAAPKYNIPNVRGCTAKEAKKKLDKIGIKYEICDDGYSAKYKKGLIYDQSVRGATNEDKITLSRSKGLLYQIGSLKGKKYKNVKKKLKLFKIDFDYTYASEYGKGRIVDDNISGTQMHKGERGSLTLSNGKYVEKKAVGADVNRAKQQFPGAKFKIKYKLSTAKKNKVLSCGVGFSSNKNKVPVTLTLSNAMLVKVPNMIGKSEDKAIEIMRKKGINYEILNRYYDITSDPTKNGGIVTQQGGHGKRNRKKKVRLVVVKPAITISQIHIDSSMDTMRDMGIQFRNETEKDIATVKFNFSYYNRVGEKMGDYATKYVGPLSAYNWEESSWQEIMDGESIGAVKPLSATVKFMTGATQTITFKNTFWHTNDYAGGNMLGN